MDSVKLQPTHKHPLTLVAGQSECKACNLHTKADHYYHCFTCRDSIPVNYHKECITYSSEITSHPYHPIHPLQICTRKFLETTENCFWCNRYMGYVFYRCSICNLNIHLFCASQPQLVLTLDPGKNHHHPLTIFPRMMHFTCNICARFGHWFPIYACVQCDLMVHRNCLDLPRVIRISCHEHRISRKLYLPPGRRLCGVCHLEVDPRYGAFLCTKSCDYAVHTLCATLENVWDGSELEDVPEDVDELQDVEPYEVIDDNLIKHFSHKHHLRFVLNLDGDKTSRCQACNLLIEFENLYTCDLCDFILHQECANFRKRRWHPLHRHPLTLKADDNMTVYSPHRARSGFYSCSMCTRFSSGFRYVCEKENCHLEVDVRCVAIPEKLNHKCHPHPLFVCLMNTSSLTCGSCRKESKIVLYCLQCPNYFMCFECATLPDKVLYKHDKHPLILCCGEEEEEEEDAKEGHYWCETCETKLDPKQWFYNCNDCGVTLHIPCLLGTYPYFKPGPIMIKAARLNEEVETIWLDIPPDVLAERYTKEIPIRFEEDLDIVANNTLSRPLCCHCDRRCQDSVALKQEQDFYCSLDCLCNRKLYHDSVIFPKLK